MRKQMKHINRDAFIKHLQSVPESEVLERIQTKSGHSEATDTGQMEREKHLKTLKNGVDSDVVEQFCDNE